MNCIGYLMIYSKNMVKDHNDKILKNQFVSINSCFKGITWS